MNNNLNKEEIIVKFTASPNLSCYSCAFNNTNFCEDVGCPRTSGAAWKLEETIDPSVEHKEEGKTEYFY